MRSCKPLLAALALGLSFPAACATAPSSSACPPLVEYAQTDLARAADELEALPAGAMLEEMLRDYQVLRDQVRACRRGMGRH